MPGIVLQAMELALGVASRARRLRPSALTAWGLSAPDPAPIRHLVPLAEDAGVRGPRFCSLCGHDTSIPYEWAKRARRLLVTLDVAWVAFAHASRGSAHAWAHRSRVVLHAAISRQAICPPTSAGLVALDLGTG